MDVAIVTGASSGIGLAVARKLVEIGFRVYGLGGDYRDISFQHEYFVPTQCNLVQIEDIRIQVESILEKEGNIYVLVNNAKYYPRNHFLEEVNLSEIEMSLQVNLLCPLILTRLVLPGLIRMRGFLINIAATSSQAVRGGPTGAATSGGLRWMGESLFEELRDSGVKVTTVFPQVNRHHPADAGPSPRSGGESTINPRIIADAIERIVRDREGNIITELVIRPELIQDRPILPPLHLPFPKPKKSSFMPARPRKEDEEKKKAEAQERQKTRRKPGRSKKPEPTPSPEPEKTPTTTKPKGKPKTEARLQSESPARQESRPQPKATENIAPEPVRKEKIPTSRRRRNRGRRNPPGPYAIEPAKEAVVNSTPALREVVFENPEPVEKKPELKKTVRKKVTRIKKQPGKEATPAPPKPEVVPKKSVRKTTKKKTTPRKIATKTAKSTGSRAADISKKTATKSVPRKTPGNTVRKTMKKKTAVRKKADPK